MKKQLLNRMLALVLAAAMILGTVPPVSAASTGLSWKKSDQNVTLDRTDRLVDDYKTPAYKSTDTVRVSIVLKEKSTLQAGFSTLDIAKDTQAIAYNAALQTRQESLADVISLQALDGKPLDVVWNMTLVGNIISANVPYGKIRAIGAVEGVARVVVERQYSPDDTKTVSPQMYSAAGMTGATTVWTNGYTGAGSRVAIVDTGTDTDHQSFNNDAYLYALKQNAEAAGISYEDYLKGLDLLDAQEIDSVLPQLNVTERIGATAQDYYINEKMPFGANYVDRNLVVDHDWDYQGSHGSHVAGIAAANRYIPSGSGFLDAREAVQMCGVAPDAQILTMKVFGNAAGPFDSDYFAAIEDAIWLGADSVNLSLGSGNPGDSYNDVYGDLLAYMETTDTVVVMSAGNSGYWAETTKMGYLYHDDVNFATGGAPGSYTNSLGVASVENDGTISNEMGAAEYDSHYYTMSSFSSWGVPGNLSLKPEITAPGGMIWSIDGMDTSGTAYEMMSGTSMAAPQVSGMAALLAEYIRDRNLDEKTNLSARHLAHSLLMSTAQPLFEEASGGQYYSLLTQGAGLARIDLATQAESYILVDGMPDGKVKAELGEDPDRVGKYSFSFTINNLNGQAMSYVLCADMFTQDVFDGGSNTLYMDTWTRDLDANVFFTVNGVTMSGSQDGIVCDLNGDGATDDRDADYLLEYLMGNQTALHDEADVNGDGAVTSYDAHVLLTKLTGVSCVDVPANGTVKVEVTMELTGDTRSFLDTYCPNGAYLEAFVYAQPISDAQGAVQVTHSIPVLGFYGSWTESSMYDVGSYLEYLHGMETRLPYLYEVNGTANNFLTINYGDGAEYYFGGNPYITDSVYLPQRNSFNNVSGGELVNLNYGLIRNATETMLVVENAETGELYMSRKSYEVGGAYYHVNAGSWQNTMHQCGINWTGAGVPEGTTVNISLIAAPELYRVYDESTGMYSVDWSRVGEGAYLTTQLTVDNTAPEILDVSLDDSGKLNVTAKDSRYIAAVALMNGSGSDMLVSAPGNQTTANTPITVALDLTSVFGSNFLLAVFDYAGNQVVYELSLDLDNERPYFTAIDRTNVNADGSINYVVFDVDSELKTLAAARDRDLVRAAEYVDGYVFEITDDNKLYVVSDDDPYDITYLRELDPDDTWQITGFNDLAFNWADSKLYGLFYSELNSMNVPYLCTIDLYTGQMTVLGEMPIDANALTIDSNGNFYSTTYGQGQLYTYTADVATTRNTTSVGSTGYSTTMLNAMAWDHSTDELYWACSADSSTSLLKLDPSTGAATYLNDYSSVLVGLYIRTDYPGEILAPTNQVSSVSLAATATTIMNCAIRLDARVWPWNVSDDAVVWSVTNPDIATVDANGVVTGVSRGTTTVTATSVLDPGKSASCQVTVSSLNKQLNSIVWDEYGGVWWTQFNTDTLPAYTKLSNTEVGIPLASTAVDTNGKLYAASFDTSTGVSTLYTVNPETLSVSTVGQSSIAYMDMAYAPNMGCILAPYFNYLVLVDVTTGEYIGAFDWSGGAAGDLVGITYYGSQYNSSYGTYQDFFLVLDDRGNVYLEAFIDAGSSGIGYFNGPEAGYVTNIGDAVDLPYFQGFYYDGSYTYWTRFNQADDEVELIVWDCDNSDAVFNLGTFPAGEWPVSGLYSANSTAGSNTLIDSAMGTASVKSTKLETNLTLRKTHSDLDAAEPVRPTSSVSAEQGTVTVQITLPADATNGTMEVGYDAALELISVNGMTGAFAYAQASGSVKFAFAAGHILEKDSVIAELTFSAPQSGNAVFTVTTDEWNDGTLNHSETISLGRTTIAEGWSGDTTWVLTDDGVLTFSGSGAMKNYTDKTQMPWYGYFDQITSVVIGDGITRIGDYAFYGMPRLQSITIAESVTAIGNYAFKNCPVLDGVKLPSGLTKLGESAFYACTGLTSIDIPASLWTIQPYTFKNCTALSGVTFHEGNLQKISDGAFYNTGLTSVILPDCLDILDVYVFKNCTKLTSIKLSASLTQIREAVLYGTAIREIVIPEGVTVIQPYAFKNCVNLTTVSLPGTLTSVDEAAFYACSSLTSITLPDKVTTIGDYAFRKCTGLTAVTFGSGLLRIGESSFYGCTGITSLHIPEGVTVIQAYAFKGCTKLANLSLPGTLTTIGDSAFHTCTSLKTIVIPAKVTGIGAYCFSGSYNLWKITFLGDAPTIGNYAFKGLAATAYYPGGNSTWTSAVRQNYGGTITWKAN